MPELTPPTFYLASKSPRRLELLRQLGLQFEVTPADIVEQPQPGERAADYARRIALEKARAGQRMLATRLPVLGADTDVVLDGRILGKPSDREDALAMLAQLSGRVHEVYSAVAMVQGQRAEIALSVTQVEMLEITPQAAAQYWDSGEPADKAGAYAIQGLGSQFVKQIRGSYSGVVGLPLSETMDLLLLFGIHLP
jgi:septum formation protein